MKLLYDMYSDLGDSILSSDLNLFSDPFFIQTWFSLYPVFCCFYPYLVLVCGFVMIQPGVLDEPCQRCNYYYYL